MGRVGITIVKSVLFRGVQQEFSNTYYYQKALWPPVGINWVTIVNEIVQTERNLHSTDVLMKRASVWSADGGPGDNEMLHEENLTGTGQQTTNTSMDRERAVLVRWPAGKDSRGRPVYLRKWYHSCGGAAGTAFSASVLQNTAELTTVQRNDIATAANALREIGATETADLCSRTGRANEGNAECHRYLEHHQLGDMWR